MHIVQRKDKEYETINQFADCVLANEDDCRNYFIVVPKMSEGTVEKAPNNSEVKCLNGNENIGFTHNGKIAFLNGKVDETWD